MGCKHRPLPSIDSVLSPSNSTGTASRGGQRRRPQRVKQSVQTSSDFDKATFATEIAGSVPTDPDIKDSARAAELREQISAFAKEVSEIYRGTSSQEPSVSQLTAFGHLIAAYTAWKEGSATESDDGTAASRAFYRSLASEKGSGDTLRVFEGYRSET